MKEVKPAFWGSGFAAGKTNEAYDSYRAKYKTSNARYYKILAARGWLENVTCPYCKEPALAVRRIARPQRWRCKGKLKCYKFVTATTLTHLHRSHIPTNLLLAFCFLVANHTKPTRARARKLTGKKGSRTLDRTLKILKPLAARKRVRKLWKKGKYVKAAEALLHSALQTESAHLSKV